MRLSLSRIDTFPFEGRDKPAPEVRPGIADGTTNGPSALETLKRALAVDKDLEGGVRDLCEHCNGEFLSVPCHWHEADVIRHKALGRLKDVAEIVDLGDHPTCPSEVAPPRVRT